jgi:ABC-type ATPase with predicted acetyltransferase domain
MAGSSGLSPLAALAAEAFGWPVAAGRAVVVRDRALPRVGKIDLYAGPSGGGKSTRLRALQQRADNAGWRVTPVDDVRLEPALRVVEQFGRTDDPAADLQRVGARLACVGLGEARVFLARPDQLSDGQRWRLRLAVAVHQTMRRHGRGDGRKQLLVCDEFAALLDRVSAATVARSLRRAIDRLGRVGVPLAAAVATSHDDLRPALLPDRVRWCEC